MRKQLSLSRLLMWGLSVFFHGLYHSQAWAYDWIASIVSVGRWNAWINSVVPDLQGPRILEIGHGTGHLQVSLASQHKSVFGIDKSPQMGRIAQRKMRENKYNSLLVNGLAQSLPYRGQSFNQVVATFPTTYIFEISTLEEIFRVLTPDGLLIVLPEAWITGTSPGDRLAAFAFRVLGQAPEWNDRSLGPFWQAGFTARVSRRQHPGSEVLLIQAVKQNRELSPAI